VDKLNKEINAARADPKMKALQQPGAGVIPKQIGVAHVGLQHVHALVPAHVAHLEHRGLGIVAKHHARFQTEMVALLGSLDAKALGIWIVRGWNEVLTERAAQDQLRAVMTQWAKQDENALLKKAAGQALGGLRSAGR
jgi:hypothetical protein